MPETNEDVRRLAELAGVPVDNVVVHSEGWHQVALLTPDLVFRFPRRPDAADQLVREAKLLPVLAPRLPVPVPRPVLAGLTDDGLPWARHRRLPGVPVTRLGPIAVGQLAGLLAALHDVPVREAVQLGVPGDPGDWRPAYAEWADRVRTVVSPVVDLDLEPLLRKPLDLPTDGAPALTHGDLRSGNLLGDPVTGVLTGVLDWGGSTLHDPALDLNGVVECYGQDAAHAVAEALPVDDPELLVRRAVAWAALAPVYEVLFGLEQGSDPHRARGLSKLSAPS